MRFSGQADNEGIADRGRAHAFAYTGVRSSHEQGKASLDDDQVELRQRAIKAILIKPSHNGDHSPFERRLDDCVNLYTFARGL